MMMVLTRFMIALTLLMQGGPCYPQEKHVLNMGINQNFSETFNQGQKLRWSHRVTQHLLQSLGYQIKVKFRPSKRLPHSLRIGDIDCFLSTRENYEYTKYEFTQSTLPVSVIRFLIYYDASKDWTPSWPPDDLFKQK